MVSLVLSLLGPWTAEAHTTKESSASSVETKPAPRTNGDERDFFQFNAAGASHNDGDLDVADAIVASIQAQHPRVVTLNELCENQYNRIVNNLPAYANAWVMTRNTWSGIDPDKNCDGHDFGNALLTWNPMSNRDPKALPPTGGAETRKVLCATTSFQGRNIAACVVHIAPDSAGSGVQDTQVQETKQFANNYRNGMPLVLGGDFNVEPRDPILDRMYVYGPDASGQFQEVDELHGDCGANRCGEETWHRPVLSDKKYDYIFVTHNDFKTMWGDATSSDYSDHDPLWGDVDNE